MIKFFFVIMHWFILCDRSICSETHNLKKETIKQQYHTVL